MKKIIGLALFLTSCASLDDNTYSRCYNNYIRYNSNVNGDVVKKAQEWCGVEKKQYRESGRAK